MTDIAPVHPTDPFAPDAINASDGLDPVAPAFTQVLRLTALFNMVPLAIGASLFDYLLIRHVEGPYGLITALAWVVAGIVVAPKGRLLLVLVPTIEGGRIVSIDVVADPDRLRAVDLGTGAG